jgi:aryl sulfotransferase
MTTALQRPERTREYTNAFMDSRRWDKFEPRDGDIIVCTSYKSGTTWTQMLCALLVFKSPKFPRALGDMSPWFDMRMAPVESVLNDYRSQNHRRIIKTHTALDGLPYFDNVTYLFCGRAPRDTFISMQNHGKNQNIPHLMSLLVEQGITPPPPPDLPEDINERFRLWLTKPAFPWEEDGFPYWSVFSHTKTFWAFRDLPNIHFLHYADLKADLEGQMRRLASLLGIEIEETLWPSLVDAASFDSMKRNADNIAPDTVHKAWRDNAAFFHKGANEQWREILDDESIALYERTLELRAPGELGDWLEVGFLDANIPYYS